ncbi:hypothetical protein M5689_018501 [Euphorbia peplus]|nr:hypothetical protein M5689_018501 [Euphorbia peplus]
MLHKLLNGSPFSRSDNRKPSNPQQPQVSSVLKIIHAGGLVECYYMAIPAIKILEKYPAYVLAKPEVFRRPWDSVVRPEKILTPGQKFLLVPLHTVRKLRRKMIRPSKETCVSFISNGGSVDDGSSSFMSGFRKSIRIKKHVTFVGVDNGKQKEFDHQGGKTKDGKKHRRTENAMVAWHPSLTSVIE